MKFCHDAGKTPYINFSVVLDSEDYFRSSIVPTLNVSVDCFLFKTTGTKIYDLDSRFVGFSQQDIFWFQICMYDLVLMQETKGV